MNAYRAVPGSRPLSAEEFERLPEEGEYRMELVRGGLVREPRPGMRHGGVSVELAFALAGFVRQHGLGRVICDSGFVLFEDPPTVRGPDVAFVAAARIPPDGLPVGFWRGAPDLAVEVVSPSNRPGEIREKVMEYLEAGARLVWVVDPRTRTIAVHRPGADASILEDCAVLDGDEVLPGFGVAVADVFVA